MIHMILELREIQKLIFIFQKSSLQYALWIVKILIAF